MGNENEIEKKLSKSRREFLPEIVEKESKAALKYSITEEFEKTKKNVSYAFYLVIVGFIALVLVSTFVISQYIESKSKKVDVIVSDFESVNLKEIFDAGAKYKGQLAAALKALEALRIDLEMELGRTPRDKKKIAAIRQKIKLKKREIAILRAKIARHNRKLAAGIKKNDAILNNASQLHELKMNEQKQHYLGVIEALKSRHQREIASLILKYNPTFKDEKLKSMIAPEVAVDSITGPSLKAYSRVLADENIFGKGNFSELHKKIKKQTSLTERLRKIPYMNSVDPAIKHLSLLNASIVKDYEKIWSKLANIASRYRGAALSYQKSFDYMLGDKRENGYIVGVASSEKIYVHINNVHQVKSGTTAAVFRKDDEYIAKIELIKTRIGYRAKALEIRDGKTLMPFDKILINLKSSQENQ